MKDCLVTQLKSVFNDESLKFKDKLVITLPYVASPTSSDKYLRVVADEKMTITTDSNFTQNGANSFVAQPGVVQGINVAELYKSGTKVTIHNVYGLRYLQVNQKNARVPGLDSLFYGSNFQGVFLRFDSFDANMIKNHENIRVITLLGENVTEINGIDNIFKCKNLQVLRIAGYRLDFSQLAAFPDIKWVSSCTGNINNLPLNIEKIYVNERDNTGSIEELVNSFVTRGRTSGVIKAEWLFASRGVTYKGMTMNEYSRNNGLTIQAECYVSWDGSDITFSNTAPSGYVEKDETGYLI